MLDFSLVRLQSGYASSGLRLIQIHNFELNPPTHTKIREKIHNYGNTLAVSPVANLDMDIFVAVRMSLFLEVQSPSNFEEFNSLKSLLDSGTCVVPNIIESLSTFLRQ